MLVGNYNHYNKNAGRLFGGTAAAGGTAPQTRANFMKPGAWRGIAFPDRSTAALPLAGVPNGYSGRAYFIPITDGMISSAETEDLGLTAAGTIYGGVTADAVTSFGFDTVATGGLITLGEGSATFGFSTNAPLLTASLAAEGAATFGFSTNTPILGALAGGVGEATFGFSGTLTSHAIGIMEGTTAESGVTVDNVVAGVWGALASENDITGSMGEKLNDAGSASNPWTEVIESGLTAAEVLRIVASVLAGKVSGGGTGTETFVGLDGTTDRVVSVNDASGNRTSVTIDGA